MNADDQRTTEQLMLESGKLNQNDWRPTTERAAFRMAWPTLKYLAVF